MAQNFATGAFSQYRLVKTARSHRIPKLSRRAPDLIMNESKLSKWLIPKVAASNERLRRARPGPQGGNSRPGRRRARRHQTWPTFRPIAVRFDRAGAYSRQKSLNRFGAKAVVNGRGDRLVAEPVLDRPGVVALVGEGVATSVTRM